MNPPKLIIARTRERGRKYQVLKYVETIMGRSDYEPVDKRKFEDWGEAVRHFENLQLCSEGKP